MSAFKRINVSDYFVVPYTANKSWDIKSESLADHQVTVNVGIKPTTPLFDPNGEFETNGQYDRLVYDMVNATYYPTFFNPYRNTSSIQGTPLNDGTLATESYHKGLVDLGNLNTIKYFPTGNGSFIYVINFPRQLTSDKLLPTTFELYHTSSSNEYKIYDDGNYNLLFSGSNISSSIGTVLSQSSYVGNVFYEQNIAVLTIIPKDFIPIPTPSPTATPSVTPSVTPSISVTPSVTPSISVTPSVTPTISVTPSPTPSTAIGSVIVTNESTDIPILNVTVGGASITYVSGDNFTISSGQVGNFSTTNLGTQNIIVSYDAPSSNNQNITITDSVGTTNCYNTVNGVGGIVGFVGVVNSTTPVTVLATNGTC